MQFELKDEELVQVAGGDQFHKDGFCVGLYEYFVEKQDANTVDPWTIYYAIAFEDHNGVSYIRGRGMYIKSNGYYVSAGFSGCFEAHEIAPAKLSGQHECCPN